MPKYAGRKAVVIGGATGLGLAIAKRLVEGGAEVLLTADPDADLTETTTEVGPHTHIIRANQPSPPSPPPSTAAEALASAIQARLGDIDFLFVHAEDGLPAPPPPELLRLLREGASVVLTGASADDPTANSLTTLTRCRGPADETAATALRLATETPTNAPALPPPHPYTH
ncbi:SDR family NAD(P)-dependent oxidoreductase [Streptomyces sp. NPDC029674]|uniref:SDR family NAD(P)-dependent oxidoreductase n=1 Tax=Streptomyces sp. NPDC029674 TaxID=3365297 RepID=UPI00384CDF64